MSNIKNSTALDKLIEYSKKIGKSDVNSTATERFIVAICDLIDGTFSIGEIDAVSKINLCNLLMKNGVDIKKIKASLLAHIDSQKDTSLANMVYWRVKLSEAQMKAQEANASEIAPELLLECVLNDPTQLIRSIVIDGASADKNVTNVDNNEIPADNSCVVANEESQEEKTSVVEEKNANSKKCVAELTEKVKKIRGELLSKVYGQDNAIDVFTAGYFQSELLSITDKERVRPRATFLFAGPPGVGKTLLAETAAKILHLPFHCFDMSEYSDSESVVEFCGSDKVYKNGKAGNVTGFVESNPKSILLFDEIEKAHISVIHLFLQMLDAGRLRDNFTDTEVPFTDTIIIFTTNAGKQLYEQSESGDYSGISRKVILKALQKDKNSETGQPFFPPAICSRFASGNVVMFNHIGAHDLHNIAKREVLRHANNFEKEFGISIDIDEEVYSAILFAEGGIADARTIRSRSETFFDNELFELFRLMSSDKSENRIENIEKIKIGVQLPDDEKIVSLFNPAELVDVLVFSSEQTADMCRSCTNDCNILNSQTVENAKELMQQNDIKAVLIDIGYGLKDSTTDYLNAEDVESISRDFFWYVKENNSDIPVYLLQTSGMSLSDEEKISFMKLGARKVVKIGDDRDSVARELSEMCESIHQQNGIEFLAKSNKVVSFETAQSVINKGTVAEIKLFDFKMSTAIDSEDSENILSNVSKPNVRFEQVSGADEAKKELQYVVDYLKNPKKYMGTGVKSPKGILLYGPPGTGKTMLAKAMACESDVTFIATEGNQFLKRFYGEGPDKVHELFRTARKYAPSIIFIDEIDAIAKERKGGESNSDDVLTAFLTEMDGFQNDTGKPVFVLAATNFDVEAGHRKSLDQALMRRFDRRVYIDLPSKKERIDSIKSIIDSNKTFEISESEIESIAIRSTGMSIADLKSVMELALRSVIRDGGCKVTDKVLEDAFETFNNGEEKKWDDDLLKRVARHEAGHAFLCWQSGEVPSYLTIVARGNHGGYMQHDDNEGKAIYTKDELLSKIRTSLGGRASEIVYYGEKDGISTGASGDLYSATKIATQIVCTYGMDEKFGLVTVNVDDLNIVSPEIRTVINEILSEEMNKAIELISNGRNLVDKLVEQLMLKSHLSGEEIKAILES